MNKQFSSQALIGALLLIVAIIALSLSFFKQPSEQISTSPKVKVITTFYPLADFVTQVGGDRVKVVNLTPAGVEPHDFEPTPQDLVSVEQASVFVYNGAGFEPWVEKTLTDLNSTTTIVNSSVGVNLVADPHIWLDPVLASQQVDNILAGLIKADPENRDYYQKNATAYKNELAKLDENFRTGLTSCEKNEIVTSHDAFAYMAKRYGFKVVPITGLSPEEEPSPKKIAEVADFAKENDVKYIFFETLVEPRLSQTIADEIGAQTLVFNPLEGLTEEELIAGQNYLYVQGQNLANLKLALNCP